MTEPATNVSDDIDLREKHRQLMAAMAQVRGASRSPALPNPFAARQMPRETAFRAAQEQTYDAYVIAQSNADSAAATRALILRVHALLGGRRADDEPPALTAVEHNEADAVRRQLVSLLATFSDRDQQVLRATVRHGIPVAETAKRHQVSATCVTELANEFAAAVRRILHPASRRG